MFKQLCVTKGNKNTRCLNAMSQCNCHPREDRGITKDCIEFLRILCVFGILEDLKDLWIIWKLSSVMAKNEKTIMGCWDYQGKDSNLFPCNPKSH